MELLVFLAVIVGLVVWLFVASEFSSIARDKGYDSSKYFWCTLLLGAIGMLMVIALPNKNSNIRVVHSSTHTTNDVNATVDNNDLNSDLEKNYDQGVDNNTYKNISQSRLMLWYIKDIVERMFSGLKK